ncbi:MAG: winged helix-turn-helix domain-containing protein [Pseudomonadaceae bacterium]|nr:winged helix-turn-helix domain-containing protein [Pseudomonadaceae bacterium]
MDPPANAPATSVPALSYAIKCQPVGRYALFLPLRQLLVIADSASARRLALGFAPARLLELLLLKADVIVTREEIFAYAWPARVVSQNSLNQAISSLRELLGDEQQRQIIQTVPRRGYLFSSQFLANPEELPVFSAEPHEAESMPVLPALDAPVDNTGRHLPFGWPLLINTLLMLLLLFLLGSLVWRVDVSLLIQPGLVVSTQQQGNQRLLYTAASEAKLVALENNVQVLRERLLRLADQPGTLMFNRMHDFYDLVCIDRDEAVESLLIHNGQLAQVSDQQLLECLK